MNELKKLLDKNLLDEASTYLDAQTQDVPVALYNQAYISYKKGDLASAHYFLVQAKSEGLFSTEMDQAIMRVKNDLGISLVESNYSKVDTIHLFATGVKVDTYYALITFCIVLAILIFKFINKYLSVITLIPIAACSFFIYTNGQVKSAINTEKSAVFRGPSRIFEQTSTLPIGVKFIYSKTNNDWKYIEYPEIFRGWVYKSKVLEL